MDEARSKTMRAVKSKNTTPELFVRRLVHGMGFRFRLHRRDLPGSPDLVFVGRRKVIFVHGCFWHGHSCKRGARVPKANHEYWVAKIARNKQRDKKSLNSLTRAGWGIRIVWECELRDVDRLALRLYSFLS